MLAMRAHAMAMATRAIMLSGERVLGGDKVVLARAVRCACVFAEMWRVCAAWWACVCLSGWLCEREGGLGVGRVAGGL